MYRATTYCLIGLCAIVTLLAGCERRQHLVQQHLLEFGTIIEITIISADLVQAESLLQQIEQRLRRQRSQWHAWEDSDLSRFNRQLQQHSTAEIPPSLSRLLELSRQYYDASGGLFNPAMGKLIAAYGFHEGRVDAQAVAEIQLDIPDMLDLSIDGNIARSADPNLQIDLGGIAKGYAIGLIGEFLDANGVRDYVVNAGGDLVIAGSRFGRPWRIGIQNPFAPGVIASVDLEGKHSLFTSGNYARNYYLGNNLRHHIIDPRSGKPARGQSSATVLGNDPVRADVAATALMIDGTSHPRELSQSLEIKDYLIISETREIQISRSFAQKIDILTHWPVIIID
ncbi:MAG TPA: FAD:protein FMN transferase [Gammaproteobacteria bacterium]|nr:FAD:protein FMN transferase [Gammaproteobacteria bacterium]